MKEDLAKRCEALKAASDELIGGFDRAHMTAEKESLEAQMAAPTFWNDPAAAQTVTQKAARVTKKLAQLRDLSAISDLRELVEMADETELHDLETEINTLEKLVEALRVEALYTGEYDTHDALVALKTGNGGQDAEDFCAMLLRMYLRWAERTGARVEILEESKSDVGLKSALISLKGEYAYGNLRAEHGVHRLIRMSPFNAKGLRQTSFARVEVLPDLGDKSDIALDPADLRIDVFRSSGAGGQSVNTTDSAVRITYLPLGLIVTCQNEKSQLQNKESAMRVLKSRLLQLRLEQRAETLSELRGEVMENSFGSQIRTYTLQPYKLVKDHRTDHEENQPDKVFDGEFSPFTKAFLRSELT